MEYPINYKMAETVKKGETVVLVDGEILKPITLRKRRLKLEEKKAQPPTAV